MGLVGGGVTGEGQGMRCHFPGCPWTVSHEEQAQEALADPIQKCRQLTVTYWFWELWKCKPLHFFHKKKEQSLASLLQKQELTKAVTLDHHFLVSVLRRGWVPSALFSFSPGFCGQEAPGVYKRVGERKEGKGRKAEERGGGVKWKYF